MSAISFTLDHDSINAALKNHVANELGLDVSNKKLEVTLSIGRKTAANPNPNNSATITLISASDDSVKTTQEAVTSEEVPEALAETSAEIPETQTESEVEVDENGEEIKDEDLPLETTEETAVTDEEDDLFN